MERPIEGASDRWLVYVGVGLLLLIALLFARREPPKAEAQANPGFVGGLQSEGEDNAASIVAVRHHAAQPGDEIATLRYFRIEKGTFPEFLEASQQGVWPYFEKLGARVVGMWEVVYPEETTSEESPDYDEVYLMTRYASIEHWRATRTTAQLGGNGPDYDKCMKALQTRRTLTLETTVQFLQGSAWQNPPVFMPAVED